MSTYPVYATTGADGETAVTTAPGGASVGPAGNGTNLTDTTEINLLAYHKMLLQPQGVL